MAEMHHLVDCGQQGHPHFADNNNASMDLRKSRMEKQLQAFRVGV